MSNEIETNVPDSIRPYLNEIAERLWAGRAVVMVGAGFSKNADSGFPDWNELGDLFYLKAHGVKPDLTKQKYLNVLRLAEEVQAAIGRPALETLLRTNIPDLTIEPSSLHVELLELPWVDIFTTNYDTLLERASTKVVTRRYEPVVNKEDIPYAIKPRIVKLHGSFPSQRPFIITEEDYRRYPHDYAPFVNTVQQALLENTFCLIGFSGDDPNFLQWIGWIRDNLGGDKTQKIFLVGVFDLSSARLQLLAQRGIVVVDLSSLEGIGKKDHLKAYNKLFAYMHAKRPDDLDWPYSAKTIGPKFNTNFIEAAQEITEEWRTQRQTYPGWLILPHENREKLWMLTKSWLNYFQDIEKSPAGLDILYVFELIWRLERCLLPVFSNIADLCEKLLKKYWPFNNASPYEQCQYSLGVEINKDLPWADIRQAWLAIALAMLRFYREEGQLKKWEEAESQLKVLYENLSAIQREFLNYEGFLFSLFSLDLPSAKQRLENWRPNESQPYWMAKRAASLAEIVFFNDIDDQIQQSLVETRKKNKNDTSSLKYLAVSNEAYQIFLQRYINSASYFIINKDATPEEEQLIRESFESNMKIEIISIDSFPISTKPSEYVSDNWEDYYAKRQDKNKQDWEKRLSYVRDLKREEELKKQNIRLDELKAFRCDPWNELELFKLSLSKPPVQRKDISEKHEFDIGRVSQTYHFDRTDDEALSAYAFLRFCEEIGLPFRVGSNAIATNTAAASLQRISRYSFFWAIATLTRLGDTKAVDNLFSRESVYRFTADEADKLIQSYLDALNKCRDDINAGDTFRNNNYGLRLAQLLPEVISRLCCKCSIEIKHRVLGFITEIYSSPDKTKYGNVRNLINRFINSLIVAEQYSLIPELLKIPFPENFHPIVENEYLNPFLLININQKPERCEQELKIQPEIIANLLKQGSLDEPGQRRWAITSLVKLYELQLLDVDQNRKLADAIWSKTDQHSLPDKTDFYKFAFLNLPHPESINPSQLFKDYIRNTPFPIQKKQQDKGVGITRGNISLVYEIISANNNKESVWTTSDAIELFNRLLEWWDADKDLLKEKERIPSGFSSIPEEFRSRFARVVELIANVVGPKLSSETSEEIKTSLKRLLEEIRENGLPVLEAEVACLHIFPDQKSVIYNRINEALISNQDTFKKDGLKAIGKILLSGINTETCSVEPDAVSMISQYLTWCPTHSITTALWIVVRILKNKPTSFSANLEIAIQLRLNRLLTETEYTIVNQDITFDEKLEVRRVAAILASTLLKYYNSHVLSVPPIIEDWRNRCLSLNEFAEIRKVWND